MLVAEKAFSNLVRVYDSVSFKMYIGKWQMVFLLMLKPILEDLL